MEPHEMAMEALAAEEQAQDLAFRTGREIIRKTKRAISGIHNGRRDPELIDSVSSDLAGLCEALEAFPRVLYGQYVEDAMAEFAETVIYDRALRGEDIPDYTVLEVSPSAWLLGLADSVGELRRDMLARLMDRDAKAARSIYASMESLSEILMGFDVKDSVAPVRRKQDICRGIMEKSRGDLAAARIMGL